jgi:hypothetical protein
MDDQLTTPNDLAVHHQYRPWDSDLVRSQSAGIVVDLLNHSRRRSPSSAIVGVHFLEEIIEEPVILFEEIPSEISCWRNAFRAMRYEIRDTKHSDASRSQKWEYQ